MQLDIRHIVFDLDHTLWDYERASEETLRELFEAYALGRYCPDFESFFSVFKQVNHLLWQAYNQGQIEQAALRRVRFVHIFERLGIPLHRAASFGEEYVRRCPHKPYTLPYVREALNELRAQGYLLHILTNGFADVQYTKLQAAGIECFFHTVVTSCVAGAAKPQARAFRYFLQAAGCPAHHCLMVGDNWEADVWGARQVGMHGIWYNPRGLPVPEESMQITCFSELKLFLRERTLP